MAKVLVKLVYYYWVDVPGEEPEDVNDSIEWRGQAVDAAIHKQRDYYPAIRTSHDIVKVME